MGKGCVGRATDERVQINFADCSLVLAPHPKRKSVGHTANMTEQNLLNRDHAA